MLASASDSVTDKRPAGAPFLLVNKGDVSYSKTKDDSSTPPILLGRSHDTWRDVELSVSTTTFSGTCGGATERRNGEDSKLGAPSPIPLYANTRTYQSLMELRFEITEEYVDRPTTNWETPLVISLTVASESLTITSGKSPRNDRKFSRRESPELSISPTQVGHVTVILPTPFVEYKFIFSSTTERESPIKIALDVSSPIVTVNGEVAKIML
mmetsp:Transcript_22273/g.44844  ORF Transcript_22273/g.44844 Transcript_22273/m.44844 type:complete len:212 (-) Transcript_22273:6600-7235(-)